MIADLTLLFSLYAAMSAFKAVFDMMEDRVGKIVFGIPLIISALVVLIVSIMVGLGTVQNSLELQQQLQQLQR